MTQRQLKLTQKDLTSSLSYITIKHWKTEDQKPAMDWQNRKFVFIWYPHWRGSNCCVTYFLFPTETWKNRSEPNSVMWPTTEDTLTYYTVARRGNSSSGHSSTKLCRTQNLLNIEDWPTAGCHNITDSNWLIYGGEISRDVVLQEEIDIEFYKKKMCFCQFFFNNPKLHLKLSLLCLIPEPP